MLGCVHCFFALVSPLSLRLFRFVEVSISSDCSVFFFFFFFYLFERDDGGWVADSVGADSEGVVTVIFFIVAFAITSIVCVSVAFIVVFVFVVAPVVCSILLFPLSVTWIHLSCFGWFPGFRVGLVVGLMVSSWLMLLLLLILLLVWLLFNNSCGQVLARWPSCLQEQQSSLLPSMTTIICCSWKVNMWGRAWKPSLLRQKSRIKSSWAAPSAELTIVTSFTLP